MLAEEGGHGPRPIADQREIRASHQFQDVWTHHVPPRRAPYFLRAALTDGYANDAHQRENDLVEIKAKELVARVCRAEKRRAAAA